MTLTRNQKILYGAGAAGVLLMLLLITRGSSGGGGDQAPVLVGDTSQTGGLGAPSTFADNGAYTSQMSNDVTNALYGVSDALSVLPDNVAAAVREETQPAVTQAPAQLAATGDPAKSITDTTATIKAVGGLLAAVSTLTPKAAAKPAPKPVAKKPDPNKGTHYTMPAPKKPAPKTKTTAGKPHGH